MNLNNITIPDSVTSIGYLALSRTDNLKDIYFTGTEQQWQTISKSAGISSQVTVHYHYGKTPLTLTSQPQNVTVNAGETAEFSIEAEGDDLTYHWQISDDDGQTWRDTAVTTAAYTETASADSNGRCVRCIVTDKYGSSVTSDAAVLRVNIPLRIISQPEDLITEIGAELVFTIVAEGDDLTYKWQISDDNCLSWRTVTDVTGDTLRTTLTEENNHRCFQCIIRDSHGGKIVSHTFSMEYPTPVITRQPEPVIAASGATVRFSVEAEGDDLTYQWQLSDDAGKTWRNSSVKTAVYSTTLTQVNNGRFLRCIVTDPSGASTVSDAACMKTSTLTVTRQPVSVTGKIGDLVTFRVEAIGSGVTYQWQLSDDQGKTWRDSKATTATYSTTLSSANNGRYLRCVVTDAYGSRKISDAVSMKTKGPAITVQPTPVTALNGDTVRFSVRADGTGLNYQWQLSDDFGRTWRNSSTKAADYATTLTQKNNSRYLRCIVTDRDGMSAISNATYMKISSLAITEQPLNVAGNKGELIRFTVTAKGPGITWQWQLSDDAGRTWRNSKNTTSSYATTLSTSNNRRYVRCIVTDKYGNKIKSNAASMKIK